MIFLSGDWSKSKRRLSVPIDSNVIGSLQWDIILVIPTICDDMRAKASLLFELFFGGEGVGL